MSIAQTCLCSVIAVVAIALAAPTLAQQRPQDDIDRNLQERAARELRFQVRLQEDRELPPPAITPNSGLQFVLPPTPGVEILRRQPTPTPVAPPRVQSGRSVVNGLTQLQDSQRRRQVELQTQTQTVPDPARAQRLDLQQLQFERETRAQQLGSSILRDSARAMGR